MGTNVSHKLTEIGKSRRRRKVKEYSRELELKLELRQRIRAKKLWTVGTEELE